MVDCPVCGFDNVEGITRCYKCKSNLFSDDEVKLQNYVKKVINDSDLSLFKKHIHNKNIKSTQDIDNIKKLLDGSDLDSCSLFVEDDIISNKLTSLEQVNVLIYLDKLSTELYVNNKDKIFNGEIKSIYDVNNLLNQTRLDLRMILAYVEKNYSSLYDYFRRIDGEFLVIYVGSVQDIEDICRLLSFVNENYGSDLLMWVGNNIINKKITSRSEIENIFELLPLVYENYQGYALVLGINIIDKNITSLQDIDDVFDLLSFVKEEYGNFFLMLVGTSIITKCITSVEDIEVIIKLLKYAKTQTRKYFSNLAEEITNKKITSKKEIDDLVYRYNQDDIMDYHARNNRSDNRPIDKMSDYSKWADAFGWSSYH